jgi:hypothetical protein
VSGRYLHANHDVRLSFAVDPGVTFQRSRSCIQVLALIKVEVPNWTDVLGPIPN